MGSMKVSGKGKGRIAVLVVLLLVVIAAAAFWLVGAYQYRNVFLPGTTINGFDVSGKTAEGAEEMLAAEADEYSLTLVFRGSEESIEGDEIDYQFLCDGSVEKLLAERNLLVWFMHQYFGWSDAYTVEMPLGHDTEKLQAAVLALPEMQEENMTAPVDAAVVWQDSQFAVSESEDGTTLDREKTLEIVEEAVTAAETTEDLTAEEGVYENASVTSDDAALAAEAEKLNGLIQASVTYQLPDGDRVLDGDTLKTWLVQEEDGTWDKDETVWNQKIAEYVADLAAEVDTIGTDLTFHGTEAGDVTVNGGSYYGWQIDQTEEISQLTADLAGEEAVVREPVYLKREASTRDDNNGFGDSYIDVDLSAQHLWIYVDGEMVLETDVVSGKMDKKHHTPEGIYYIYGSKMKNVVLRGADYQSPVKYWMPLSKDGIGLHDASWRSSFGGSIYIYSGSHGCVNLPPSVAGSVYEYLTEDMPVVIYYPDGYTLHS